MRYFRQILPLAALVVTGCSGVALAAPVSGSADFSGGLFGDWTINYASGAAGLLLEQVTITLAPGNFFDTTPAGPGQSLWQDLTPNAASAFATGYSGADPATAAGRNGATSMTLFFSDFEAGESFSFDIDVDQSVVCGGSFLARLLCQAGASLTTGNELAGSSVEFTFGGENYEPTTLPSAIYSNAGGVNADLAFSADITATPEPATFVMLGAGLLAIGLARRRRPVSKPSK